MTYVPSFNSPELNKVFEENVDILTARFQEMNKISLDIKSMEKLLTRTCFLEISIEIDEGKKLIWNQKDKKIHISNSENNITSRLIESKAITRQNAYKYLPELLKRCAE